MQLAIDDGDYKWAGLLREKKAVLQRGEEGYLGDLAVQRSRLTNLLLVQSAAAKLVVAPADGQSYKPHRLPKSTRQRIAQQRQHSQVVQTRQTQLQEIERLAKERSKFEKSHIPNEVKVRIRAPSFLYPTLQDAGVWIHAYCLLAC